MLFLCVFFLGRNVSRNSSLHSVYVLSSFAHDPPALSLLISRTFSLHLLILFSFCPFSPIPGIPASSGNSLDSFQDDNPPHWLKSLQALTEMDAPSSSLTAGPLQPPHSVPFAFPLHRPGWAPYPATANPPTQFHSPPPGFQSSFRPTAQTATDLLQSAGMDRH